MDMLDKKIEKNSILEKGTCKSVFHQNVFMYFNNVFNYLIKLVDPFRTKKRLVSERARLILGPFLDLFWSLEHIYHIHK